jgi:signal transduction histidine kinase
VDSRPPEKLWLSEQPSIEWLDKQGYILASQGELILTTAPRTGFLTLTDLKRANYYPVRSFTLAVKLARFQPNQPPIEGYLRVSQSTEEVESVLNQLRWQLGISILVTLILVWLSGIWLAQKSVEPVEQSLQLLKQFTDDASHELRSPLTAIKLSLDVLRKHPDRFQPKDAKKLEAIASATNQMIRLTEDLLFLARGERTPAVAGERSTTLSLNQLLPNLVDLLEPSAQAQDIHLHYQETDRLSVVGDEPQLIRLFSNLLENAIQYTPSGGKVILRLSRQEKMALVAVEDTGIGLAPEDVPRVFTRFWRADKARSRRAGGTGLGLSIVQAIVQRHGGKIEVRSQLGIGSCFLVSLPLSETSDYLENLG